MNEQDQRTGEAFDPTNGKPLDLDQVQQWDAQFSWHPFTPMKQYLDNDPLLIVQGKGMRIQDRHGRWYWDGCSSVWLNIHGHRHPYLDAAITRQLKQVAHVSMLGQANVPASLLAKRLIDVVPKGLERVHLSDCGATAVEIAVKTAIQYWFNQGKTEKQQVIGFQNNYHGDTLGAMAVAPSEFFHKPFLKMLPVHYQLPFPMRPDQPMIDVRDPGNPDDVAPLKQYLERHAQQTAAVIVEPVEGAGGMCPAPSGFLKQLRSVCDQFDVLLIVDEVATGFGHTGDWFACTAEGVTPDILCLGKGISGGYLPVAATICTSTVYEAFLGEIAEGKTLYHGHSFAGNPLGCAVSLASLDLMPKVIAALPEKVALVTQKLEGLEQRANVHQVRQRGLMVGVTVCQADGQRFDPSLRAGYVVAEQARKLGLVIRPIGDVVILLPPPAIELDDLSELMDRFVESFAEAESVWAQATACGAGAPSGTDN